MIINRKWTKLANLIEPLFYIIFRMTYETPCNHNPYHTASHVHPCEWVWDFTTANGSKERACFTFIVFTCRWEAECSGCRVIHYWLTEWMWTMCVSERSGSPSELHDWPLGEDTALPPIYLHNAAGSDRITHKWWTVESRVYHQL